MTTTSVETELFRTLNDFRERFNTNPRVQKLIVGWERNILVDAMDTGEQHTLVVKDMQMAEVVPGLDESNETVHLQGEESLLIDMFAGRNKPAAMLMDGVLAVFSSDKDKVKLEALAMVIWGI